MPTTLEYSPLQSGEIRLLSLERVVGQLDDDSSRDGAGMSSVGVTFTNISINARSIPSFTALSYVWGDASDTIPLEYLGGSVFVTRNLHEIMSCLAPSIAVDNGSGPTTYLWIDALCIDQTNLEERAAQVSLMRQIYSRASSVLVFLSATSEPFQAGLSFLKQAAEHPEWHYEPSLQPNITVQGGLDARSETLRDSIIALFATPWWSRVWTVQEFVLAGRVTFRCGSSEVDGATMLAALASLRDHESGCCRAASRAAGGDSGGYVDIPSRANGGLTLLQATMRLDQLHIMRNAEEYGQKSMLGALALFRRRACIDPRDHIFGILGLDLGDEGQDLRAKIRVDYATPAKQLFEDAALAMIHTSGKLNVLSHICQYPSVRRQLEGLPSWVPDWTATMDETFHHWYSQRVGVMEFTMASGDNRAVWNRVGAGKVATKALVLGTISTTAPGYPAAGSSSTGRALLDRWREVYGGHADAASEGDLGFGSVLAGDLARKQWHEETGGHDKAFRSWCAWFGHDDPQMLPEDIRQDARLFDNMIRMTTLERRMFRTGNGRVGFGPESSAEGHVVAIIPGGSVPYILKKVCGQGASGDTGKEYSLLGDGYVQGVMLGEAATELDESGGGWEDIILV